MKKIFEHLLYSYLFIFSQFIFVPIQNSFAQEAAPSEEASFSLETIIALKDVLDKCKSGEIEKIQEAEANPSAPGGLDIGPTVIPCEKFLAKENEIRQMISDAEKQSGVTLDSTSSGTNSRYGDLPENCYVENGKIFPMSPEQLRDFQEVKKRVAKDEEERLASPDAANTPKLVCDGHAPPSCLMPYLESIVCTGIPIMSLLKKCTNTGLDCLGTVLKGIWTSLKSNVSILGDAGSWIWEKGKNLFSGHKKVENDLAQKTLIASQAKKKEIEDENKHKGEGALGFIKRKLTDFYNYIMDSAAREFTCLKEVDGKCVETTGAFECANCSQKFNTLCGIVGYLGGEVIISYFTGGALKAIQAGMKGLKATAIGGSISKLAGATTKITKTGVGSALTWAKETKTVKYIMDKGGKLKATIVNGKNNLAKSANVWAEGSKLGKGVVVILKISKKILYVAAAPFKAYLKLLDMAYQAGRHGFKKASALNKAAKTGQVAKEISGVDGAASGAATFEKTDNATAVIAKSENKTIENSKVSKIHEGEESGTIAGATTSKQNAGGTISSGERPKKLAGENNSAGSTNGVLNADGTMSVPKTSSNTTSTFAPTESIQAQNVAKNEAVNLNEASLQAGSGNKGAKAKNSEQISSDIDLYQDSQKGVASSEYSSAPKRSRSNLTETDYASSSSSVVNGEKNLVDQYKNSPEYKQFFNELIDPKDYSKFAEEIKSLEAKYGTQPEVLFRKIDEFRNTLVSDVNKFKADANYKKYFDILTDEQEQKLLAHKIAELEEESLKNFGKIDSDQIVNGVENYMKQDKFLPYRMEYTDQLKKRFSGRFESGDNYKVLGVDSKMLSQEDLLARKAKALDDIKMIPDPNLREKWTKNIENAFTKLEKNQSFINSFKGNKYYHDAFEAIPFEKEESLAQMIKKLSRNGESTSAVTSAKEYKDFFAKNRIIDEATHARVMNTRDYAPFRDGITSKKDQRFFSKHIEDLEKKFNGNRQKVIDELKKEDQLLKSNSKNLINPRVDYDKAYFQSLKSRNEYAGRFAALDDINDQKSLATKILELEKKYPKNKKALYDELDRYMAEELGTIYDDALRVDAASAKASEASHAPVRSTLIDDIKVTPEEILNHQKEYGQYFKLAESTEDKEFLSKVVKNLEQKYQGNKQLINKDLQELEKEYLKKGCRIPGK